MMIPGSKMTKIRKNVKKKQKKQRRIELGHWI